MHHTPLYRRSPDAYQPNGNRARDSMLGLRLRDFVFKVNLVGSDRAQLANMGRQANEVLGVASQTVTRSGRLRVRGGINRSQVPSRFQLADIFSPIPLNGILPRRTQGSRSWRRLAVGIPWFANGI